jgi:hypothetical protein
MPIERKNDIHVNHRLYSPNIYGTKHSNKYMFYFFPIHSVLLEHEDIQIKKYQQYVKRVVRTFIFSTQDKKLHHDLEFSMIFNWSIRNPC